MNLTIEQMRDIDSTLSAIASLCPANIPEIERLPICELKVGDECVLIWSKEREVWKVKSFCSDGDVDIVHEPYNAHMCVPASELRLVYRDSYTDHVSDIRNHIAPTTVVLDVHVNEALRLNRLG